MLNETVRSYLWRLAEANGLAGQDLQLHLTGSAKKDTVTAEQLAAITGRQARTLRYAMPELCTLADLAGMRLAGRPRPGPTSWGWRWPYNRTRYACNHCAARRGVPLHRSRAQVWTTHEDVICLRHQRWLGTLHQDTQPDLTSQPDILRANRQHRRLITRYGRERVRTAVAEATPICRDWSEHLWSGRPFHQRIAIFERQGDETRDRDSPAVDAATYPDIVGLARLFASPYWRHQATVDNLNPEPFDYTILATIHEEIRTGQRRQDDIPEDIRIAAAGVLRLGPGLIRFTSEIQRTANPDYHWYPWSHHRKFPPITQWIMDQIDTIRDPDTDMLRSSEPPPEHYEDVTEIPRPRAAARQTIADHATDAGRPGRGANLTDSLKARA